MFIVRGRRRRKVSLCKGVVLRVRLCNRGLKPGPGEAILDKAASPPLIELFGMERYDRELNG